MYLSVKIKTARESLPIYCRNGDEDFGMTESRARSKAFAPATVANVACGFDVLGLALEAPGDTVTADLVDEPGIAIAAIEGDFGRLSREPEKNTAAVAARSLLRSHARAASPGVRIEIQKGLPLASGMGSSAASAVAAAVAVADLLRLGLGPTEVLNAALEAERAVAGSGHADNAAACLYGGFVLVRSTDPLDVIRLPVPPGLSVALLRPHLEISTRDSRLLLGDAIRLENAVRQWAHLGGLVAGLYSEDLDLVSRSLSDFVAEPLRSRRVPGFSAVKRAALDTGALGSSLSGSGPSIFALCRDRDTAAAVAKSMGEAFAAATDLEADLYVSAVSPRGARVLREKEASCAT
jgi:homoserine kinase